MSEVVARPGRPATIVFPSLVVGSFAALAAASLSGRTSLIGLAAVLAAASLLVGMSTYRLEWRLLLAGLVLVILFIPIRRYTFPGNLPFALEPYRILVALLLTGWLASSLIDRRVRLRRTFLDPTIALILFAVLASLLVNVERATSLQAEVLKALTFFASFVLLFYLVASVVRKVDDIDVLVKILLVGGAVVAMLSVVEYWTGVNVHDSVLTRMPFLEYNVPVGLERGAGVRRAFGSAEHPIALGAALTMLIPLALYIAKTSGRRYWWAVLLILVLGTLTAVSRTSVLMLVAAAIVVVVLRAREAARLVPLAVVMIVLAQVAVPGSVGTLKYFFFPEEGLVQEQRSSEGSCLSQGRVADIGPSLDEYSREPLLGYGFGTRVTVGSEANACLLDNQWLGSLLETGTVGALAFLWLFVRYVRRLGRVARADASPLGWLAVALAASVTSFAIGMFVFDAFSFIQVTFLLFILLGLGTAVVAEHRRRASTPRYAYRRRTPSASRIRMGRTRRVC